MKLVPETKAKLRNAKITWIFDECGDGQLDIELEEPDPEFAETLAEEICLAVSDVLKSDGSDPFPIELLPPEASLAK